MESYKSVGALWNSGDETVWQAAIENYYRLLRPTQIAIEQRMEELQAEEVERMSVEEFYQFLHDEYFLWKYTAKNRLATTRAALRKYISEDCMWELAAIKEELFRMDHRDAKKCLTVVSRIRGLGAAGASGLLAILYPQDFGTVDQFVTVALRQVKDLKEHALLERMNPQVLTVKDGAILEDILRAKADELNYCFQTNKWTPRKIDMALWAVGR